MTGYEILGIATLVVVVICLAAMGAHIAGIVRDSFDN